MYRRPYNTRHRYINPYYHQRRYTWQAQNGSNNVHASLTPDTTQAIRAPEPTRVTDILVFGSSHINRLKSFEHDNNLTNLGLDTDRFSVSMYGVSGGGMFNDNDNKPECKCFANHNHVIKNMKPNILILQVGSNDIGQLYVEVDKIALSIIEFAESSLTFGCKLVIILSHWARNNTLFNMRLDPFNKCLKDLCSVRRDIMFWQHTSLGHNEIYKYRHSDGVHLNSDGNKKLYKNIRGAVIYAARKFLPQCK